MGLHPAQREGAREERAGAGAGPARMKLIYSAIFKAGSDNGKGGPVILTSAAELSSFGYFQRGSYKEACAPPSRRARGARGGG